jgi:DNA-binding GntR family transcriptional regulator
VSQSVIREALMRLVQQRLVILEQNHGFRVASVSARDLTNLTVVRRLNESAALALSIEHGGVEWESEVVAAHHRLVMAPPPPEDSPQSRSNAWLTAHREFHNKLYEACDNAILYHFCESLADRAEHYQRWSVIDPASPPRDLDAEHTDLMGAVLARDTNLAVERLRNHIDRTAQIVMGDLETHQPQGAYRRLESDEGVGAVALADRGRPSSLKVDEDRPWSYGRDDGWLPAGSDA